MQPFVISPLLSGRLPRSAHDLHRALYDIRWNLAQNLRWVFGSTSSRAVPSGRPMRRVGAGVANPALALSSVPYLADCR